MQCIDRFAFECKQHNCKDFWKDLFFIEFSKNQRKIKHISYQKKLVSIEFKMIYLHLQVINVDFCLNCACVNYFPDFFLGEEREWRWILLRVNLAKWSENWKSMCWTKIKPTNREKFGGFEPNMQNAKQNRNLVVHSSLSITFKVFEMNFHLKRPHLFVKYCVLWKTYLKWEFIFFSFKLYKKCLFSIWTNAVVIVMFFFSLVYFNLINSLFPSIFYNIISAFRKCFVNVICVSIWTKFWKIFSENIESKLNNGQ